MGPTVCEGKGRKAHALSKFFRFEDMGYEYQWQFCNFSAQTGPTAVYSPITAESPTDLFFSFFFHFISVVSDFLLHFRCTLPRNFLSSSTHICSFPFLSQNYDETEALTMRKRTHLCSRTVAD